MRIRVTRIGPASRPLVRWPLAPALLLALSLAACAGRPVRDLSRHAGPIDVAIVQPEAFVAADDRGAQTAIVATAGGVGAAAGLACGPMAIVCSPVFGLATATTVLVDLTLLRMLDKSAAARTREVAVGLLGADASTTILSGIVTRIQPVVAKRAPESGPALQLTMTVSRLELRPRFPEEAELLLWIEARLGCAQAPCPAKEARQRYVHVGASRPLRDLEQNPGLFASDIAVAQEQIAWKLSRDLRR